MSLFDAIVLGVIEGIAEFLPISSTGHLILANFLLGIPDSAFVKSFDIVIQLGAISAAVLLYWRSFLDWKIIKSITYAFIPTGVIGLLLYKFVKEFLLGNTVVVVASLALGGVFLIVFELLHKDEVQDFEVKDISPRQAFLIGLCQSVAIIPGVSRSAATIIGGLMLGIPRATIVEFSFLIAAPTMLAATGLDLAKNYSSFAQSDVVSLLIGFIVSFVVAIFAIRFLLSFVRTHTFIPFGIYRIIIAIAFVLFFLL